MMLPNQSELQNLLSTHITVQVEVLFYHLGQCFSFADLFSDGFNVFVVLSLREMVGAHQPSLIYLSILKIFKIMVTTVITQLQKIFTWIKNVSVIVKFFKNIK